MKKLWLIFFLLLTTNVFAEVLVLEPRDCKFFSAVTGGADHTSAAIDVSRLRSFSVQVTGASLTTGGSYDGALKIQTSDIPSPGASDWVDKSSATGTLAATNGTAIISFTNNTERWARIVYAHTSITGGTVTGYCHGKSI